MGRARIAVIAAMMLLLTACSVAPASADTGPAVSPRSGLPVQPATELITTVAQAAPGPGLRPRSNVITYQ